MSVIVFSLQAKEKSLHHSLLTLDSHVDISREYMNHTDFDPALKTKMKVDFTKMKKGGLDAVVFVVYVEQKKRNKAMYQWAYQAAKKKFSALHKMLKVHQKKVSLARTSDAVKQLSKTGKRIAIIGVENGFTIGKDLKKVNEFYQLGARYIGLTHSGHNDICDSSTPKKSIGDRKKEHNGLSTFGLRVVQRMNELGMMIDISHASDSCVISVLQHSSAPIIASHSGARHLLDHPRNLPDHLIKKIAQKGGVIQLVGYSGFIKKDPKRNNTYIAMKKSIAKAYHVKTFSYKVHEHTPEYEKGMIQLNQTYPLANVKAFVDHIEHVIKIAGIDHVGISSDFDGGGELDGWKDASESENITLELIRRGYNQQEVQKIWSENFLRTWKKVELLKKH
jgi:membrane dipeptidase